MSSITGASVKPTNFTDVLKPAISLLGTTAITSGLGVAYWAVAARIADQQVVGQAGSVVVAMQFWGSVGMFGFGTMLIAEGGRRERPFGPLVATSLMMVTVLSSVAAIITAAVTAGRSGVLGTALESPWSSLGLVVGVALSASGLVLDHALIARSASGLQLVRNTWFAVAKLVVLVALPLCMDDVTSPAMVWAWVSGLIIAIGVTAWLMFRRGIKLLHNPSPAALRGLGSTTGLHNWLDISMALPRMAIPLIASWQFEDHPYAAFYVAWMVSSFVLIVPHHLATGLFTVGAADQSAFADKLQRSIKLSLVVGVGAIVLAAISWPILAIFGSGYTIASWALSLIALAYYPNVTKQLYNAVARVQHRMGPAAIAFSIGGILEIVGAAIGAHIAGLTGLGLGFLIATTIQGIYFTPPVLRAARGSRVDHAKTSNESRR